MLAYHDEPVRDHLASGPVMKAVGLLLLLILGNILNVIDRNTMSLFLPVIRQDIHMSATQAGLITGLAFIVVYCIVSIPISRITDAKGPRPVLAGALVVWSGATFLCGIAGNFYALFAARMMVGAGESGFAPAAHTALAAVFSKERLGRAISIFMLGAGIGQILGFYVSGAVAEQFGWRPAFQIIGLAGVLLGALLYMVWPLLAPNTVLPPKPAAERPGIISTFRILFKVPAFKALLFGATFHAIATFGAQQWIPSFLHDTYDMDIGQVGLWMGLVFSVASISGTAATGFLVDRFRDAKLAKCMHLAAWSVALTVPFYFFGFLFGGELGRLALAPAFFLAAIYYAPMYTVLQKIVPDEIRASANAIVMTSFTVVGLGLGPTLVGISTDLLELAGNPNALGISMSIIAAMNLVSAVFFFRASGQLGRRSE